MSAKWYVVNVHSGCEKKVAQSINEQVALKKWEDRILEILIPTEEVVEVKDNVQKSVMKKMLPGYVIIKMILTKSILKHIKRM